jgi:hypothetical protein
MEQSQQRSHPTTAASPIQQQANASFSNADNFEDVAQMLKGRGLSEQTIASVMDKLHHKGEYG